MKRKMKNPFKRSKNRRVGGKKTLMRDLAISAAVGALQGKLPDVIMEKTKGMAPAIGLVLAGKMLKSEALIAAGAYAAGRGIAAIVPALQGDDGYESALERWTAETPSITGNNRLGVDYFAMGDDEDIDLDELGVEYFMEGEDIEELNADSLVGDYQEIGTEIVSIDPDSLRAEFFTPASMFGEGEIEEVSQRELDELVRAASMSGFLPAMRARVARTSRQQQQGVAIANAKRLTVAANAVNAASNRQVDPAKRQALRTISTRLASAAKMNANAAASVEPWKERSNIVRTSNERIVDPKLL